jgi:hypothetical protein
MAATIPNRSISSRSISLLCESTDRSEPDLPIKTSFENIFDRFDWLDLTDREHK